MKSLQISQVDAVFSGGSYPIEFLFYFENGVDSERIRKALRRVSPLFWPLFGRYERGRIEYEGYREEEHLEEKTLTEVFDPAGILDDVLEARRRFSPAESGRLFFLKILHFVNGSLLVPKISHMAGDGYSYFYFLSALAAFSKKGARHLFYRALFRPQVECGARQRRSRWDQCRLHASP